MKDLSRATLAFTDGVLSRVADPEQLRASLAVCARSTGDRHLRREEMLRMRLAELADQIEAGLNSRAARTAAWDDLIACSSAPQAALDAAYRLFALARLVGHEVKDIRESLRFELDGRRLRPVAPAGRRLACTRALLADDVARETIVVRLRLVFARVGEPQVVDLGPSVRLYDAAWLRSVLVTKDHPDAPADAAGDDLNSLLSLCSHPRLDIDDVMAQREQDLEMPLGVLRIELRDVTRAGAVDLARRTALTVAAIGPLDDAAPSLWRVDSLYAAFRDGLGGRSMTSAPVAESATFAERVGVNRERTDAILRH